MRDFQDYMRVTDILYPFSGLETINPIILQNAAIRGEKVHRICDAIISGMGVPEVEESLKGYYQSFNYWLNCPVDRKFIRHSHRFFCDRLLITGECDAIFESEEGLTLVDFKTSAKEGKTWQYQGSAYSYLASNVEGLKIDNIIFVMLNKTGKMPNIIKYNEDFKTFMNCYECYKKFFKNKNLEEIGEYL